MLYCYVIVAVSLCFSSSVRTVRHCDVRPGLMIEGLESMETIWTYPSYIFMIQIRLFKMALLEYKDFFLNVS